MTNKFLKEKDYLEVLEFNEIENKNYWLQEIKKSDWNAGQYLYELLTNGEFNNLCGSTSKVLLLVNDTSLISFCTLAEQDDIRESTITPWIGFLYTFSKFRGKRCAGKLLEYAYIKAKREGYKNIYISTTENGLYEKYGYVFYKMMKDVNGENSRVYKIDIEVKDYSNIIGEIVTGKVDRPLGSYHPQNPEMIYPINYGYVNNMIGGDGEKQDVYILGIDKPIETYRGKIIAVYHRINDVEDKWIVSLDDKIYSKEEILGFISFQEQYFIGELYQ